MTTNITDMKIFVEKYIKDRKGEDVNIVLSSQKDVLYLQNAYMHALDFYKKKEEDKNKEDDRK